MNFMQELLLELEEKEEKRKLELDRLRADQLLTAIGTLEQRAEEINELADNEVKLIEDYRSVEVSKVQKKISWLSWNLHEFMKSSGEKTINLPHGVLKLRLGRDKVTVLNLQQFLDVPSNHNYLRIIPESYEADIQAIHDHIKTTGHIPDAVDFVPAGTRFSYKTIKTIRSENNGKDKQQSADEVRVGITQTNKITVVEE